VGKVMEENTIAVNTTTEAPVTESAPVETSTVDNSIESSEKTEISNGESQDSTQAIPETKSIPYDRFAEVNEKAKKYEAELAELKAKQEESERLASMTPDEQAQQQQLEVAKETLKKLGFVTKEEQQKMAQEEKAANMFISECNRLEGKYDGSDGMPKFVATEVAGYMDELAKTGQFVSDPETAYKLKNLDQIAEAKAKQQRSSTYSEKQQGGMNQVNDTRSSELEAAAKTGDFTQFLKKFAPMPKA
jgi:hypothetical protein